MRLAEKENKELIKAERELEQKKARLQELKNKAKEESRKRQTHYKCIMGGCVAKYFPECYLCSEEELNTVIRAGINSTQCQSVIRELKEKAKAETDVKIGVSGEVRNNVTSGYAMQD